MKIIFKDQDLEELYTISISKLGKKQFSKLVVGHYQKKIDILKYANDLADVARIKGLHLEKLNEKAYKGCYSIRVDKQYRIIFKANKAVAEIIVLELSKHYE